MKKETFWSIIIEPDWVQAALWSKLGEDLKIISSSKSVHYTSDNLIEVVDSCLTEAISEFPEDEKEPSKTVFGVPSFWVKEGSIEKEHLEKIKEICTKLSLSPTGFVVLSEAVAHSIKFLEGSPLTGVVLNISKNFVSVSVFKLGNLIGTVNVGRSNSVFEDVVEGLSRFEMKEPMPTRFIVFGGDFEDIEEQNQVLIKSDWTDLEDRNLRFLHTPQFESMKNEQKTIAISIAGASEIGQIKNIDYTGVKLSENEINSFGEDAEISVEDQNVSETNDLSASDIGFVVDQDIAELNEDEIAVEEPIKKNLLPKFPAFKNPLHAANESESETSILKEKSSFKLSKFINFNKTKTIALSLFSILLISFVAVAAYWWYIPKAEVVIYVSPKRLEAAETITLEVEEENIDPENMIFLASQFNTEISETKQKNTTGSITVGDKASGRITVRNGTSNPVKLSVGDSIFGPNNLEFVVLESASVSAALSPSEPGQATVNAEASDIGAEYNIAKDETMRVEGYSSSDVDAIVNESFSGGSSREIVAVSQNDLDILESELIAELKRKGIAQLESQVTNGRFIPESVDTDVVSKKFSSGVGKEASSVSLDLVLEVTGIAILDETIDNLSQKLLNDQIPEGFSLRSEQVDADFELIDEVETGTFDFDVVLSANLLPEVNIDNIKKEIMGKYPPEAEEFLSSIQGFSKAEVSLNPRFFGRLGVIPRIEKNISIEIRAER